MGKYDEFFAILKEKGIDETQRKELIKGWTAGRTDSLKDLTNTEFKHLLNTLKNQKGKVNPADVMRKKVIFLLCSMGEYTTANGRIYIFTTELGKPQMWNDGIYKFISNVGYLKKQLNDYTIQELPKLVTQIEQLRKNTWGTEANKAVEDLKNELL